MTAILISLRGTFQYWTYLNNTIVGRVSIHSPIFNFSTSLSKPLGTVSSALLSICIILTFRFYSFLTSLTMSKYLSLLCFLWYFHCISMGQQSSLYGKFLSFLLLIVTKSGVLAWIKSFVFISKSQRILWLSFCRKNSDLWIYHLVIWSSFNFLHNSQWITFLTQSCLVLYSFSVNLLHSFIMWSIVLSLLLNKLQFLFYYVLSILDEI